MNPPQAPQKLTLEDAKQSLIGHVTVKGLELREKYGPHIGWQQLKQILQDPDFVRYPCEIVFDATPLRDGEFAYPMPRGENPEEGFVMCVHPYYSVDPASAVYLVLYQLVLVNYGDFASADDAEAFGSAALGLTKDDYYDAICALADEISIAGAMEEAPQAPARSPVSSCGGGCGCAG